MANAGPILSIGFWLILAIVVALTGLYAARVLRRWTERDDTHDTFTLQDLRELRAAGQISAHEFESMRAAILGSYATAEGGRGKAAATDEQTHPPPDAE